jgi:diacylglycerol kinase (ATP)
MNDTRPFSLAGRARSFSHAFRGLAVLMAGQHNAWVHALATALVVVLGFWLRISRGEWCLLVVAMGLVWTAEALNTAVEELADAVHPERHSGVGRAKDVGAAGVLLAALAAAAVGMLILVPRLLERLAAAA